MSNTATVVSVVELSANELATLRTDLQLGEDDKLINLIDKSLIAGLKISINGQTIDLSVKRQLGQL